MLNGARGARSRVHRKTAADDPRLGKFLFTKLLIAILWQSSFSLRYTPIQASHVRPSSLTFFLTDADIDNSGFMSSVDLHTHSGFQRILPEAFAIVCAPTHTPKSVEFRTHSCDGVADHLCFLSFG